MGEGGWKRHGAKKSPDWGRGGFGGDCESSLPSQCVGGDELGYGGGWVEKALSQEKNSDRGHSHGAAAPLPPPSAIDIALN